MMEFTYQQLDTVKTQQQELIDRIDELSRQFNEDSEERTRTRAEAALVLQELREAVDMLSYRIDDNAQLFESRSGGWVSPRVTPADSQRLHFPPPESLGTALDTLGVAPPSQWDSESEKLFKGSYMDLTLGNYDLSVQGFKNYLVRYPDAPNAPEAHYYLGESYFALSRYLEAVAEYQNVIREYPKSRFVPAAYLKSGFCYEQLEETQLAKKTLRELISLYPRSEEAEQARMSLQDMGG